MEVVLHLKKPQFTAKLRAKPTKALASLVKAFSKAVEKRFGSPLAHVRLEAEGLVLAPEATVASLGGGPRAVTVVPLRAAPGPSATVVSFMASHVNGAARLASLRACLESIERQSAAPTRVAVAISSAAVQRAAVEALLARVEARLELAGVRFDWESSASPRAQFRHFAAALDLAADVDDGAWVVLSDDDDLWHPDRVRTYDAALATAARGAEVVVCPVYALNRAPLASDVPAAADVDVVRSTTGQPTNYLDCAVRLGVWREYFEVTRGVEHESIFADNHYLSWLYARCPRMDALPVPEGCWMYLWRQDHDRTVQHVTAMERAHGPVVAAGLKRALAAPDVEARYPEVVPGAALATPETMLAVFAPEIIKAERTVELSRTWFYHGRYHIDFVDAYLDAAERGPPGAAPGADDAVKAKLFPHQVAASKRTQDHLDKLRRTRPDVDVDDDQRRTKAFLRIYAKKRLRQCADRRYEFRPLEAAEVTAAFASAILEAPRLRLLPR